VGGNFVEIEYGNVVVDGLQNITEKNISLIRTSGLNELSGAMGLRFGAIRITGSFKLESDCDSTCYWEARCWTCAEIKEMNGTNDFLLDLRNIELWLGFNISLVNRLTLKERANLTKIETKLQYVIGNYSFGDMSTMRARARWAILADFLKEKSFQDYLGFWLGNITEQVIFPSLFLESKSEADEFPNFFSNTTWPLGVEGDACGLRIDWLAERLAVQAFNTFGVGMLNKTLKDPYHLPHFNQNLDLLHLLKAKVNVCNTTLVGLRGLKITALEVVRDQKLTSMDVRYMQSR